MRETRRYLLDFAKQLHHIAEFTSGGYEVFKQDEKTQYAVIRAYEVIGEIVKRLPAEVRDQYPDVNWRKLVNFRDFLAHNYDQVIEKYVWDAVEDLPNLKFAVEAMLKDDASGE